MDAIARSTRINKEFYLYDYIPSDRSYDSCTRINSDDLGISGRGLEYERKIFRRERLPREYIIDLIFND